MSLNELLLAAQTLPHADKLRLIQMLVVQLAREEGIPLVTDEKAYPIWTPYDAFDAAATLLKALEVDKTAT